MTRLTARSILLIVIATSALVGCKDPSQGKPAAAVSEPKAAASEPATKTSAQAAPKPAADQVLALTPANGKIGFVGSKVTGSHEGTFQRFKGQLRLNPKDPTLSAVEVEIEMASVKTDKAKLDKHLQGDDFFDVPKYQAATFKSTQISKSSEEKAATHTIEGNLTLRGVTKGISFPATVSVTPESVSVKSEFKINRKDFGVSYPGMKDDLIRDHVVISLDFKVSRS